MQMTCVQSIIGWIYGGEMNQDLVDNARDWLGTPWEHNQSEKGIAVDCVNFLAAVAIESGLTIEPIPESYHRTSKDSTELEDYLNRNFTKTKTGIIERNNIILYNFYGYYKHVAIAVNSNSIIHASFREGKVVEHTIDGIWRHRIVGIWSIK